MSKDVPRTCVGNFDARASDVLRVMWPHVSRDMWPSLFFGPDFCPVFVLHYPYIMASTSSVFIDEAPLNDNDGTCLTNCHVPLDILATFCCRDRAHRDFAAETEPNSGKGWATAIPDAESTQQHQQSQVFFFAALICHTNEIKCELIENANTIGWQPVCCCVLSLANTDSQWGCCKRPPVPLRCLAGKVRI